MESDSFYGFPLWVIFLLLIAGCAFLIDYRNDYYFKRIKKIMNSRKTEESKLYAAIDEINNKNKGKFSIIDYVDVKFHGNPYKLFKGTFASIGPMGEYGFSTTLFSSNYICSWDAVSSSNAVGMKDTLKLSIQNGNTAIFTIRKIRRLKKEIEKELVLNPEEDVRT